MTPSKKMRSKNSKDLPNNQLVPFEVVKRIGVHYYFESNGELIPTNETCVKNDYGRDSINKVSKYFGFINEPSHIEYKSDRNGFYNLYRKPKYKTKKGSWSNIEKMIDHIFKGVHREMILTYFYVLYLYPKHALPAIGLVGDKNTGKSNFLELTMEMFSPNSVSIDPEDLSADFNESYIDKLIITIDEKAEGGSRRKIMQRLKKLVTGGSQIRKAKFKANVKVNFFGKIIMASNDTEDMLALEGENTRFWIIEVKELDSDDFDILSRAIKEIPAFFHYLIKKHEPMKKAGRLWFNPKIFQTETAKKMQDNARPELVKSIIENLSNYFLENEDESEIYFTAEQFIEAFGRKERWSSHWFAREVNKFFKKKSYATRKNNPFHDIIIHFHSGNSVGINNEIKLRRYYHFTRKEIFKLNRNLKPPKKNEKELKSKEDEFPF